MAFQQRNTIIKVRKWKKHTIYKIKDYEIYGIPLKSRRSKKSDIY